MKKHFNIKKLTIFLVAIISFMIVSSPVLADTAVQFIEEKTNSKISNSGDDTYSGTTGTFNTAGTENDDACYYYNGSAKLRTTNFSSSACPKYVLHSKVSLNGTKLFNGFLGNTISADQYGTCKSLQEKIDDGSLKQIVPEIYDVTKVPYYEEAVKEDINVQLYDVKCFTLVNLESEEVNGDCATVGVLSKYIKLFFNIIRFLIPTIIVVYSVIDFAGVVLSGENEGMEKAKKKFIKRIIVGAIILLIPSILNIILNMAGIIDKNITDYFCTT